MMAVRRGRLVSLFVIMQQFSAHLFMILSGLMEFLVGLSGPGGPAAQWGKEPMREEEKTLMLKVIGSFESECVALGLTTSTTTVRKIQLLVSEPTATHGQLRLLMLELQGRLIDEMLGTVFLSLSPYEAVYYNKPRQGWEEIIDRFPRTLSDIEEARKCFALSRYAASVFHSIQIVEAGLIDLGGFIKVSDRKSGWTAVSNELNKIMKKRYEDLTQFEKDNRLFLEQVQGTVEALKNAWRNKISHADGKLILMTKDFSPEVAEEILFATRAFMRRLATGLPSLTS